MRWAGQAEFLREKRVVYTALIEKTQGKRTLRRHICGWEDIIKIGIRDICWTCGLVPCGSG
jgi:hypothetical protein